MFDGGGGSEEGDGDLAGRIWGQRGGGRTEVLTGAGRSGEVLSAGEHPSTDPFVCRNRCQL